jgi:predicted RNA-binding Zn ribbon-like protein
MGGFNRQVQHSRSVPAHTFDLTAGTVAGDFTNTISGSRERPGTEHLGTYADLVEFARQAGAVDGAEARTLLVEAAERPERATQVHRRAITLREAMWRAFDRIAQDREPAPADVETVGAEAARGLSELRFAKVGGAYRWTWPPTHDLARPLWPIARAAADLLASDEDRARLRECASETCAWIFVDRSKNGSRRWCSMSDCGNRAKVRAFRERQARKTRRAR